MDLFTFRLLFGVKFKHYFNISLNLFSLQNMCFIFTIAIVVDNIQVYVSLVLGNFNLANLNTR